MVVNLKQKYRNLAGTILVAGNISFMIWNDKRK